MRVALVGCGFMGQRHIRGLGRLHDIGYRGLELTAVSDTDAGRAEEAADLAASLLGTRPRALLPQALWAGDLSLDAVLVVTPPGAHENTVCSALGAGLHALVEKPISLTVASGRRMVAAARAADRRLSVAENYRRDPVNRLAHALVEAGAVGRVYRAEQRSTGSGGRIAISVWRHQRRSCGILIDMGVHYADVLAYLLGPMEALMGLSRRIDDARRDAQGQLHEVDAEDLCLGLGTTASGVFVEWSMDYAARTERSFRRAIHGTLGTLDIPRDRSGAPLRLWREEGTTRELHLEEALALVPEFELDPVTASLFGGRRLATYNLPFAVVDANLLAIEQADFADAIQAGRTPEVEGEEGLAALAVAYGWLEAAELGRPVRVKELLQAGGPYEAAIDTAQAGDGNG